MAAIVVVGAGLSGLCCAYRLVQSGHDVEVLEAEVAPGGRMRSERHEGYLIELGAQFIADGYVNLQALVRAVGLETALDEPESGGEALPLRGRLEPLGSEGARAFLTSRALPTAAKLRMARLFVDLWRQRPSLDPWRPESAAALDDEDMANYLLRTVGREARDGFLGPLFAATFDTEIEDLSAAFCLLMLRFAQGGHRLQSIEGGLGRLPAALARDLSVRSGCRVHRIESSTDGVCIHYRSVATESGGGVSGAGRERCVVADAVVVALPGSLVPALCPELTSAERNFFECVRYARGTIVHLLLEKPLPVLGALSGVSFRHASGIALYGLAVDHRKRDSAPPGAGLINVALRDAASERLWQAPDEEISRFVRGELARTPVGCFEARGSVVVRWPQMLPRFGPGYLTALARFRRRSERSPRLAFAGDYLVGPHSEGAVTSGMRAARSVVRALQS